MGAKRFTDLHVWQTAHSLALFVYNATKKFPNTEQFALTSQLCRAAISVPSNIAEGFNRFSKKEKVQFYSIALGSVSEVQSQLILANDLKYLGASDFETSEQLSETIHKELVALIKSIKR